MNLDELKAEVAKLSPYAYLATVRADGTPDVTPVFPTWDGTTVWINVYASSAKARDIAENPSIALHWQANDAGDGVEIWGTATLHHDIETKRKLWTGLFGYDLNDFSKVFLSDPRYLISSYRQKIITTRDEFSEHMPD